MSLDCNKCKDLIHEYIDNELSREESEIIRNHLEDCEDCMQEYILLTKHKALANEDVNLPQGFGTRLSEALEKEKKRFLTINKIQPFIAYAAAAIVVIGFSTVFLLNNNLKSEDAADMAKFGGEKAAFVQENSAEDKLQSAPKAPAQDENTDSETIRASESTPLQEGDTAADKAFVCDFLEVCDSLESSRNLKGFADKEVLILYLDTLNPDDVYEFLDNSDIEYVKEDQNFAVATIKTKDEYDVFDSYLQKNQIFYLNAAPFSSNGSTMYFALDFNE